MVNFIFKPNEPIRLKNAKDADAAIIGDALAVIAAQHGGELRPNDVVAAATEVTHPLHKHFEWNDQSAAHAHRLDQARALIRIVRIDDADKDNPRAFLSIKFENSSVSYRPLDEIMGSSAMQLSMLRAAKRDIDAFMNRYRGLRDIMEPVAMELDRRMNFNAKHDKHNQPHAQ